jgi:hypothetical protein
MVREGRGRLEVRPATDPPIDLIPRIPLGHYIEVVGAGPYGMWGGPCTVCEVGEGEGGGGCEDA